MRGTDPQNVARGHEVESENMEDVDGPPHVGFLE